jgi:hypothetical protein
MKILFFATVILFFSNNIYGQDNDNDGINNANEITFGTNPNNYDTDGDGVYDATEKGITSPDPITNTSLGFFKPDFDPSSTTSPTNRDTDAGGAIDGREDINKNGRVDLGETNPNNGADDISVLSLNLLSFKVTECNKGICISWETSDEVNVKEIEIQKSYNSLNFLSVKNVEAKNNQKNNYLEIDTIINELKVRKIFYRLKQIDLDGKYKFSNVIPVIITNKNTSDIYPNPISDEFRVESSKKVIGVELFDLKGKKIKTWNYSSSNTYKMFDIMKGIYFAKINYTENSESKVIIVN